MARNVDLLEGSIVGSLTSLALPIMATSLIQMAYNMTDMIWIGRLSADAVAAVGAAGMYLWLANGLAMIPRLGGQVKVAHELGAQAPERAAGYGQAAFHLGALLVILFTAMCILLNGPLIAFFKLNSPQVNSDARVYLVIVALGFLFSFFNQIFTGLFTAMGSSVVVLRSTAVGLVGNILLDPLMIFGVGPFPRMEVAGAAAATVLAQAIVTAMFLLAARRETTLFPHIHPFRPSQGTGMAGDAADRPSGVHPEHVFFQPLHVHRADRGRLGGRRHCRSKGGHPDRIHLLYHSGGLRHRSKRLYCPELRCRRLDRICRGYWTAVGMIVAWSCFTTVMLVVFPAPLVRVFIQEEEVVRTGVSYLRIMGYSQILMCLEITSSGAFQGLGRPMPPTLAGVIGNAARIPRPSCSAPPCWDWMACGGASAFPALPRALWCLPWFVVVLHRCTRDGDLGVPRFIR